MRAIPATCGNLKERMNRAIKRSLDMPELQRCDPSANEAGRGTAALAAAAAPWKRQRLGAARLGLALAYDSHQFVNRVGLPFRLAFQR